jgi:hypothetical protein
VPPKAEDFNAKTPSKAEGAKPLRLPFFLCAFALFQALEKSARNFLWRASRHPTSGKNAVCTFQSLEILSARIARRYRRAFFMGTGLSSLWAGLSSPAQPKVAWGAPNQPDSKPPCGGATNDTNSTQRRW